jgi:hypothetical protein
MCDVICNFVKSALNYWQTKRNIFIVPAKFLDLNRVWVRQLCLNTLTNVERKKERNEDRQKEEERKKTILIFLIFLTLHRSPLGYILDTGFTVPRFTS